MEKHLIIVIFIIGPWEPFHRRPMIEGLAAAARGKTDIWCMEPAFTVLCGGRYWLDKVRKMSDNLFIWRPHYWPWERMLCKLGLTESGEGMFWCRIKNKLANKNICAWIYKPEQINLLDKLDEKIKIYECYDNYETNPKIKDPVWVHKLENDVLKKVDLAFVTSKPLEKKLGKQIESLFYIGNGVDYETWQTANKMPVELANIRNPIVAYIGNINHFIDYDLLNLIIMEHKELTFLFIGPNKDTQFNPILKYPNVIWVGYKQRLAAAAYLQKAMVGLIPYKVIPFIDFSEDLKLYEYYACGLPVLSTPSKAREACTNKIFYFSNAAEFSTAFAGAEATRSEGYREELKKIALTHDWKRIGGRILDILDTHFATPGKDRF